MTIAMAAMLSACGHRASQGSENSEFTTDSIGLEKEDSMASVKVCVDWPASGNDSLVQAIRQYIYEELASRPMQEGEPEVKLYNDGEEAIKATVNSCYQEMVASWKEIRNNGYPGMQFSYYQRIKLLEDNEHYITYLTNSEGIMGGAHGFATSAGQTFRKSDGKRIGYETKYNKETESFYKKDQTLFKNAESPELYALIKQGVLSYFQEFEDSLMTDEQLKDMLIEVDDVNRIPLPSAAPCFIKEGLNFCYQQYEIAPYAAGMINFNIPYEKIRPFLTPEAAALIPE